jgi:hypothetical protein
MVSFDKGGRCDDDFLAIGPAVILGRAFDEGGDGGVDVAASDFGY